MGYEESVCVCVCYVGGLLFRRFISIPIVMSEVGETERNRI